MSRVSEVHTQPPVWSITFPWRQRVCRVLTRHRWLTSGPWRRGRNMFGRVWERNQRCRVCGGRFVEWTTQSRRPKDTP